MPKTRVTLCVLTMHIDLQEDSRYTDAKNNNNNHLECTVGSCLGSLASRPMGSRESMSMGRYLTGMIVWYGVPQRDPTGSGSVLTVMVDGDALDTPKKRKFVDTGCILYM